MDTIEKLVGDVLAGAGVTCPVLRGETAPDGLPLPYVLVHEGPVTMSSPGRSAFGEPWTVNRIYVDVHQQISDPVTGVHMEDVELPYRVLVALHRAQPDGIVSPVVVEGLVHVPTVDPDVAHVSLTVRVERDLAAALGA